MSRICEVCGRPIKTGIKYCYVCRSIQKAGGREKKKVPRWMWITLAVCLALMLLIFIQASGTQRVFYVIIMFIIFIATFKALRRRRFR